MIAIANTDQDWFEFLRVSFTGLMINFWTPTPWNISKLREGDKFYFMLKAPIRKIRGYGNFLTYINMTLTDAWHNYGTANGVRSLSELVARAQLYVHRRSTSYVSSVSHEIGCVLLSQPIFLDNNDFFSPEDYGCKYSRYVEKLKYFSDKESIGQQYAVQVPTSDFSLVDETHANYQQIKSKERRGQPQFRELVLSAYQNKCCITGETCRDVLTAAHIQPYINEESNHIMNGIALRMDLHKLFDLGLITIDSQYSVRISPRLRNSSYDIYRGRRISLPEKSSQYPSKDAIDFHYKRIFRQ